MARRAVWWLTRSKSTAVSAEVSAQLDAAWTEWDRAKPYEDIPGPTPMPLLGNTWRFIPYIGKYRIEEIDRVCRQLHERYGPVVSMRRLLGRPDMLFLFDADDVERVFRHEELMPHRPSMPSLNFYKHVLRKDFFENNPGVIAVHGEDWYKFRTRVQQTMLQPKTAYSYLHQIEETAETFVERCRELKSRDPKQELPGDFLNEVHKWSLESIARVALGVRLGCLDADAAPETQQLIDAVTTFFAKVGVLELKVPFWKLFNTPTWRTFINALDTITSITSRHISHALDQRDGEESLIRRVLDADADRNMACILALDMFLVGIDTTSTAVASILYQLSQHPEVQEKLYEELASVLPEAGTPLSVDTLDKMKYLKACIKETLRMYPVVIGNGRCMTRDAVIAGYQVPKGTHVVFQHYVISNQDRYFSDAASFQPERWLRGRCPAGRATHHPFASLPFGFGRRMCLGRRFADLEIQAVIAKMIRSFRVEYNYQPLEYKIHPMYTPDGPLRFKLIDRR